MNFLGVGPAELILILIVAVVFVGPERLPRLAADLARMIREIRKHTTSLAAEFNEVVKEFEKETESERSQWKDVSDGLGSATRSVSETLRAARQDAEGPRGGSVAAGSEPQWRDIGEGAPPPAPASNGHASANGMHAAEAADETR